MSPLQHKIYQFIQNYLLSQGYSPTLREIAEGVGISPRSKGLISRYIKILVNAGWLVIDHKGYRHLSLTSSKLQLPIVGRIAAGCPIEPIEHHQLLDLAAILCEQGCFVLEVKGQSMCGEGILDGDKIICKRQSFANEGDIVVALIDKEKATLKRIHYQNDGMILLQPANPALQANVYAPERVMIQGIFIGLLRLAFKIAEASRKQEEKQYA